MLGLIIAGKKFSVSSYCGPNFGWHYEINVKQPNQFHRYTFNPGTGKIKAEESKIPGNTASLGTIDLY